MTTRHPLFHPRVVQALLDLSNPRKSICRPLVKGRAAGKIDLIYQLYPPRGVHRNSIPATYVFTLEDWVSQELDLMVSLVDTGDGGDGLIFGFIAHDFWSRISKETGMYIEPEYHYVAVKYNPVVREGFVYMYKEAYAVFEVLNKGDLERSREMRRAKEAAEAAAKNAQAKD